ncbi:MAG: LTA synthase family protein [Oscillospiraceae bacterium]|nr:LTA synthase family protein [Oscillospiraceae bacterium]
MTITKHKRYILSTTLAVVFLAISWLLYHAADWFVDTYGRIGFDAILFTITSDLGGTSSSLVIDYLAEGFLPAVLWTAGTGFTLFVLPRLLKHHRQSLSVTLCLLLCFCLLGCAAWNTELDDYILSENRSSDIYENHYVDPAHASITFPAEKWNLIYIFLESMETSYLAKEQGGAMAENLIPELYDIARENVNFSHNTDVGGFHCINGATWTIGAMVSQTAGIPLKTPTADVNKYGRAGEAFLPGVTSLTDVLHEAGYYQALMVGSDVAFGGREAYFSQHGMDAIYDIRTAWADGIVPDKYFVWWGMEDLHLFEYARQELTEIAQREQPFAFTMLTVDTHHVGGYQCEYCQESTSGETYDQSISCSSRQVAAFLEWIQQQPFYENTTVVIVGDHESMDNGYFTRMTDPDYQRMVYNCFINAAAEPGNTQNRTFAAVDLFPTTLASLGCQIEGERLGLGTNLFSDTPTLAEELGILGFETELAMASEYYENVFYNEK